MYDGFAKHRNIAVFAILFVIYVSNGVLSPYQFTGDSTPTRLIPYSILEYHAVTLDTFRPYYADTNIWYNVSTKYVMPHNDGHNYSAYPIVTSIFVTPVFVPSYLSLKMVGVPISMYDGRFEFNVLFYEKIASAIIAALSGVVMYSALRLAVKERTAIIGLVAYALGTNVWSMNAQALLQHGMVCLLTACIIYTMLAHAKTGRDHWLAVMGALSVLHFFNRPADVIMLVAPALYAVYACRGSWQKWAVTLVPAVLVAAPFTYYNMHVFGNIMGRYSNLHTATIWNIQHSSIYQLWVYNFFSQLFSPNYGAITPSPILVLAFPGAIAAWRSRKPALMLITLGFIVFTVVYGVGGGVGVGAGYGNRYFVDVLSFSIMLVALFVDTLKPGWLMKIVYVLLVASIMVQVIGVYFYPYGGNVLWPVEQDNKRTWEIADPQIYESFRAGWMHYTTGWVPPPTRLA